MEPDGDEVTVPWAPCRTFIGGCQRCRSDADCRPGEICKYLSGYTKTGICVRRWK